MHVGYVSNTTVHMDIIRFNWHCRWHCRGRNIKERKMQHKKATEEQVSAIPSRKENNCSWDYGPQQLQNGSMCSGIYSEALEKAQRNMLRWYGKVRNMPKERFAGSVYVYCNMCVRGRSPIPWIWRVQEHSRKRMRDRVRGWDGLLLSVMIVLSRRNYMNEQNVSLVST